MCNCKTQPCNKCGAPQALDGSNPCVAQILTINNTTGDLSISNGNTISLVDSIDNFQTVTRLGTFTLTGNVLQLKYIAEDGVTQSVTVDLTALTASGIADFDTEDTDSVQLIYNSGTLQANVKIDPASTIPITASAFGLRFQSPTETAITASNTNTILLTASGPLGHTLISNLNYQDSQSLAFSDNSSGLFGTVLRSTDANNSIVYGSDGAIYSPNFSSQLSVLPANGAITYASTQLVGNDGKTYIVNAPPAQTPITGNDTNSVNLTVSGSNGMTVQADLIIDNTTPGNIPLTVSVNGLQANANCATITTIQNANQATVANSISKVYGQLGNGQCGYAPVTISQYGQRIPQFSSASRDALPGGDLYDTLLIFNTTTRTFQWYDAVGTTWQTL